MICGHYYNFKKSKAGLVTSVRGFTHPWDRACFCVRGENGRGVTYINFVLDIFKLNKAAEIMDTASCLTQLAFIEHSFPFMLRGLMLIHLLS